MDTSSTQPFGLVNRQSYLINKLKVIKDETTILHYNTLDPNNMKRLIYFPVIVIAFLFSSCGKDDEPVDKTPPGEVTNLNAISGDQQILLSWVDPLDEDFEKIEISYLTNITEVNKGVQSKVISGLTNGTSYTFAIKTIDFNGNKSNGSQISSTPLEPPALAWSNYTVTQLSPSSGTVVISTDFTNNGGSGTINFSSRVVRLSDNTITSNISNSFNVQPNVQYKITLTCNGSATKTSCTACSPSDKFRIEIISVIDNHITSTIIGISCSSLHDCGYWWGSDKTEWNSISVNNLIMEQL